MKAESGKAGAKNTVRRGRAVCALLLVLLGACASAEPYVPAENKILSLVKAINDGEVAAKGLTETPFLFEGEVIPLQNHLTALWWNLHGAGFRLREASVTRIEPLTEDSFRLFADTREMRAFFARYVDKGASCVELKTRSGIFYLLVNTEVSGLPRLQGIKGPL
jgi:hypothetical protein